MPMLNTTVAATIAIATLSGAVYAESSVVNGPMAFDPITASAYGLENDTDLDSTPWLVPAAFVKLSYPMKMIWTFMLTTTGTT